MGETRKVSWLDIATTVVLVGACIVLMGVAYYLNTRVDEARTRAAHFQDEAISLRANELSCRADLNEQGDVLAGCSDELGELTELPAAQAVDIQHDARPISGLTLMEVAELLERIQAFEQVFPDAPQVPGLVKLSHQLMERERVVLKQESRELVQAVEEAKAARTLEAVSQVIDRLAAIADPAGRTPEAREAAREVESLSQLRSIVKAEELVRESSTVNTVEQMRSVLREMDVLKAGYPVTASKLEVASARLEQRVFREEESAAWGAFDLARIAGSWEDLEEQLEHIDMFRERFPKSETTKRLAQRLRPLTERRDWMRLRRMIPEKLGAEQVDWEVVRRVADHLTSEGILFERLTSAPVNTVYGEALKDPAAERGLPLRMTGKVVRISRRGDHFVGLLEGKGFPPPGLVRFVTTADTRGIVNGSSIEFAGVPVQRHTYTDRSQGVQDALVVVGYFGEGEKAEESPFRSRRRPEAVGQREWLRP